MSKTYEDYVKLVEAWDNKVTQADHTEGIQLIGELEEDAFASFTSYAVTEYFKGSGVLIETDEDMGVLRGLFAAGFMAAEALKEDDRERV